MDSCVLGCHNSAERSPPAVRREFRGARQDGREQAHVGETDESRTNQPATSIESQDQRWIIDLPGRVAGETKKEKKRKKKRSFLPLTNRFSLSRSIDFDQ